MNTQVKVGIAAAIVAALVALIVLDQKTTPKEDAAQRTSAGGDPATIVGTNQGAEPSSPRLAEDEINRILKTAEKQFGDQNHKAVSPGPMKGSEEKNEKRVTTTATGENNGTQAFAPLNAALADVPPGRVAVRDTELWPTVVLTTVPSERMKPSALINPWTSSRSEG